MRKHSPLRTYFLDDLQRNYAAIIEPAGDAGNDNLHYDVSKLHQWGDRLRASESARAG